jgi:hypothetical protein
LISCPVRRFIRSFILAAFRSPRNDRLLKVANKLVAWNGWRGGEERVYLRVVKRKFALLLAAILLLCGWHACWYDRVTWCGGPAPGKRMANGHPFDPDALTAASWNYPLGARLKIVYGHKSVLVEVTDRGGTGAFMQFGKTVDLSRAAFAQLAKPAVGTIRVKIIRQ